MGITEFLVEHITALIAGAGYFGVTVLMALESMIAPVPSEAVMPFAGFLIVEGQFTFPGVVFFSTLGSIIGSLLSYYIGAWGGGPFVRRFGRYLLLNEEHLALTERIFSRYGEGMIFISRFIPVVRHLISIPAGVGRMNIVKFSVYTVAGAGMWNAFLTYVGYVLRENWSRVSRYSEVIDVFIVAALLLALFYFVVHHVVRARRKVSRPTGGRG